MTINKEIPEGIALSVAVSEAVHNVIQNKENRPTLMDYHTYTITRDGHKYLSSAFDAKEATKDGTMFVWINSASMGKFKTLYKLSNGNLWETLKAFRLARMYQILEETINNT